MGHPVYFMGETEQLSVIRLVIVASITEWCDFANTELE